MTTSTAPVPGYPYLVYRNGERVTHALDGDRLPVVCNCHPDCGALVVADGPLAGADVDRPEYQGRHREVRRG